MGYDVFECWSEMANFTFSTKLTQRFNPMIQALAKREMDVIVGGIKSLEQLIIEDILFVLRRIFFQPLQLLMIDHKLLIFQ